jgi:hypothetical protein
MARLVAAKGRVRSGSYASLKYGLGDDVWKVLYINPDGWAVLIPRNPAAEVFAKLSGDGKLAFRHHDLTKLEWAGDTLT